MAEFDVVIVGATGVTGRQIARYLADLGDEAPAWAIAGRNPDRLAEVADGLTGDTAALRVDLDDPESMVHLVGATNLVINAVGPYSTFGTTVWSACALTGTHQVDLCADLWWLAEAIDIARPEVERTGSRFVHSAGFLSLPFDLATLTAAEAVRDRFDSPLRTIDIAIDVQPDAPVLNLADVVSGGTVSSSLDVLRRGGELAVRDVRMLDESEHDALPYDTTAREHAATGKWLAPMLPTPYVNPVIVHRTASLIADDTLLDPNFRFRDGLVVQGQVPGIPDSMTAAWLAGSQFFGAMLGSAPAPMRNLVADSIEAFMPRSAGPSDKTMDGWRWTLHVRATATSGATVDFQVLGDGHLGYRSSANLAAETALAVLDSDIAPGVHTPGSALGTAQTPRFARAGLEIVFDGASDEAAKPNE